MKITEDLVHISLIEDEELDEIFSNLSEFSKGDSEAESRLEKYYTDENQVHKSLLDFIQFTNDFMLDGREYSSRKKEFEDFLETFISNNDKAALGWSKLNSHFSELEDYFLFSKEAEIKSRFKRITDFEVTTDVRPVFNLQKDEIYKKLLVGIIRIKTSDDEEFVCEIYEDKIDLFIEEIKRAKSKFEIIRNEQNKLS